MATNAELAVAIITGASQKPQLLHLVSLHNLRFAKHIFLSHTVVKEIFLNEPKNRYLLAPEKACRKLFRKM